MMNTSLVLVKPHACRERFLDAARDHFDYYGIRVEDMLVLTGPQVRRGAYVERHYGSVAALSSCPWEDLAAFVSEETASLFFAAFGELWETVMEERRVLTPEDAMTILGLTQKELDEQWWASKSRARLEHGLYVSYFKKVNMYVINGFYPRLLESFTAPESQTCILIVSWPESKYTWKRFRLEVLGAADPSEAEPTSLRRLLYENWAAYGLSEQPSLMNNGLECASGPLEALALRFVWMHRRATEDDFGRALLQEGVPLTFVEKLAKNPTMSYEGENRSVFELLENMQSSEVLHHAAVLYATEKQKSTVNTSNGVCETLAISRTADWTIVLDDEDAEERRNRALVFVKPHANTPETRALVEERLMQVNGMQVVSQRHVLGSEITSRQVMDKHYRTISRYAVKVSPASINVSKHRRSIFKETFGVSWKEAVRCGRVWNAETAMHVLGEISADELYGMWGACTKTVKLTTGAYVAHFCNEGVFVINGFYPYLRDTYGAPDARVSCYVLSWPESCLTWRAFREELIGTTNPGNADPSSLRGLIRDRWRDLGLQHPPTTTDNGVHASAGPLEAVLERHLWTCAPLSHDPLTLRLQECGLTGALLYHWGSNPEVVLRDGKRSGCVFDLLENMQTSEMVDVMREAEQQALTTCIETPLNRAVVIIRPFAVNERTIETVKQTLSAVDVHVTREVSLFSNRVVERYLGSAPFLAVERFANFKPDALLSDVSSSIKNKFQELFHSPWDYCLEEGKLLGATDACEKLNLTPTELLQLCETSNQKKLGPACYAASLMSHDVFVVNGFVPFVRESYGKPGSRVHVLEVEWKESAWTWHDFCEVLIGDIADPSAAAHGSLQRTLAEEWTDFELRQRPLSHTTAPLYASQGPLEAAADRERWLCAEIAEDLFVQHLLLDGVPLSLLLRYVRDEYYEDQPEEPQSPRQQQIQQLRMSGGFAPVYTRSALSQHQQSSEVVRRLKTLTSRHMRAMKMNYAFLWVKPHACTTEVAEWIPTALEDHRIEVVSSGQIPMEEVVEKLLVDQQYNALYRNAMARSVGELPITIKQMVEFERTFGITWTTAVSLHMIINAAQAVERLGILKLLEAWDGAPRKVCLSPTLYVAYLEEEGLFVINGFYPYLRSRMYTGARIYWYVVSWDGEIMTWDEFQNYVIGSDTPAMAAEASLRHALSLSWEALGLQRPPDGIDNGFHASASPIEGLADRVAWLGMNVENDVFGRLLIQGGVGAEYLRSLLLNPLVRHRDEPIDAASDVFDKLCTENPLLIAQLIGLEASGGMRVIPQRPSSGGALPSSPSHLATPAAAQGAGDATNTPPAAAAAATAATGAEAATTAGEQELSGDVSVDAAKSMTRNYAFVLMNPKCMRGEGEEQVAAYVTDFLQRHKIRVEAGGTVRGIAATLRHMADELQAEVFKYAVKQTPSQYVIDTDAMTEFFNVFGELWDTRRIRNAVEYAIEFNLSASRLKETWDACTPRKRIAPSLYIGKVPDRNVYLVNGFALHSAEAFNMSDTVKRYFLVSWDNTDGDYAHYLQHVIGDPYVEVAEPGSLQRVLLDEWRMAGLQCPPDPFEGAVITSTSALEAMQQRQLWMSLGLSHDAVGRFAMQQLGVSPYVLRWALGNPRSACGDGRYLFDTVRGKGSAAVLRLIIAEDARHRAAPPRNSAFVLVKSHALCRPFAATIETVFARAHVRIDEEGDLSGAIVKGRGLVHHLYATASRYAVRDVATIRLTKEERDSVRRQLGIAWEQLVDSGVVVNAYQALEVLGGVTPLHLYDRWRASKRLLTIRPDLVIAELEERGIFVVNGFFPELKQSLEAANVLLHWYVVSWEEAGMNWPAFLTHVIGDEFPMSAQPQSIRGQLFQRWQEYGLTTEPDMLRNGLHVSEGALQAMRERTKCLHYALPEDYLGDVMLRHGVPERVLRVWLENPDVTSGGVEAGVFEHLRHCDTSRLLVLLTALTDELNQETGGDAARIPVEEGKPHDTLHTTDSDNDDKDTSLQHQGEHQQSERGVVPHQRGGTAPETESTLLHQNTAMILVKPHASDNLKVLALLEEILAANHIRVRQEIRKQSYPRLVDKHLSSAMYYATHNYLHNYPEVTEEGRVQFYEAFNEQWEYAVSSRRVLGAFDALNRFSMTPSQLYVKWSLPQQQHVQLAYDMEVMKFHAEGVYVVNALFPFERERMLQAGPGMRDIHCYVVSWDQRKCSWHQFLQDVIGDVDPANSTETSLRGRLYSGWEEVALPSRPNRVDNIVLASGGPLQAFMERELWCGTGDLAPDPLVRALSLLDHDPTELLEWKENPLVRYTGGTPGGDWVTSRMFSITYELDTKEFVDLISEHEGFFVPISPPCEVEEAQEQLEEEQQARRERIAGGRVGDRYVLQGDSVDSTAARSGTSCEWVRAALLSLGEEDVTRLWSYYGGRTGGDSGGTNSESGDVLTPPVAAAAAASAPASMTGSIDGEAFRRDIEALDFYGLPLARGTVKKLFEGMVHRGDGRTTYEEFRRVLAVLQQM